MSRYDTLDASRELEQAIFADLQNALRKRGYSVTHHGSQTSHAIAGIHDLEIDGKGAVVAVEVTKSRGAAQDREFQSIRDHLKALKQRTTAKRCYCIFSAPSISPRTYDSIRDHNEQRAAEGLNDMRIVPVAFNTLEDWLIRLDRAPAELYPFPDFIRVFDQYRGFIDDVRVRKLIAQAVFPTDNALAAEIEKEEVERDERTLEQLIRDLDKIENLMRQHGIATAQNAIDNLIFLVFIKLYEEKREHDGEANRLRSAHAFRAYASLLDEQARRQKRAIHRLFGDIVRDAEFVESGMFTPNDRLVDSLRDDFIEDTFIPMFAKYNFMATRVDALGAVYEVLAERAGKDVKVGQFFTPENIVRFMVEIAELDPNDLILDPACGTGRFLIHGMSSMLSALERSNARAKKAKADQIRKHQCFGVDIDMRIAKLAKMNMWIHGDGKSNVFGGLSYNGLLLHRQRFVAADGKPRSFDGAFDIVLTNPPLGDINYQVLRVDDSAHDPSEISDDEKMLRFPILPVRNISGERLTLLEERAAQHEAELAAAENGVDELRAKLRQAYPGKSDEELKRLAPADSRDLTSLSRRSERKRRVLEQNAQLVADLASRIRRGEVERKLTGASIKGGALFLAAIANYLKPNAYPDEVAEWRGGRMAIILDEGILNTAEFSAARRFMRESFYIKAIISLTRDTFIPISGTSTKTSIVYATRKSDPRAVQQEPIFMAHVSKVGVDTRGKVCENDLPATLNAFRQFRQRVRDSYVRGAFSKDAFESQQ